jgi:membrane protein YdbS with pleckstrin-like domain
MPGRRESNVTGVRATRTATQTNWLTFAVVAFWAVFLGSYLDAFGDPSTWRGTVWALFAFAMVFFVGCAVAVRRAREAPE